MKNIKLSILIVVLVFLNCNKKNQKYSENELCEFAAAIANNKCDSIYKCKPFKQYLKLIYRDSIFIWGTTATIGDSIIKGKVIFNNNGTLKDVIIRKEG